jgi:SOS-response transcriptional repressor LexA
MTEGLVRLRKAMAKEPPTPFVGAGVSVAATGVEHASWRGLLLDGVKVCQRVGSPMTPGWADRMKEQLDNADAFTYIGAADEIIRRLCAVRESREFGTWLERTVGGLSPTPDGEKIIQAVRKLGKNKIIVTTNYDTLIEDLKPKWRSYTWTDDEYRSAQGKTRAVIHLHGVAGDPESVILGGADYERLSDRELIKVLNQALFASRNFIFIGCGDGLTDPNIAPLMEFVRRVIPEQAKGSEHYMLVTGGQLRRLNERPLSPRITPVAYGEHFSELTQFLEDLADRRDRDISQDPEYYERRARPRTALLDLAGPGWDRLEAAQEALWRAVRTMEQVENRKKLPEGMAGWDYRDQKDAHEQAAASVRAPAKRLESYLVQVVSAFKEAEVDIGRLAGPGFGEFAAELAAMTSTVTELEKQTWRLRSRVTQAWNDLKTRSRISDDYRVPRDILHSAQRFIDQANDIASSLKGGPAPGQAAESQPAAQPASGRPDPHKGPGEPGEPARPGLRVVHSEPADPERASAPEPDPLPFPEPDPAGPGVTVSAGQEGTAPAEPDDAAPAEPDDATADGADNAVAEPNTVRVPLLSEIAAGKPILAAGNVRRYLELPAGDVRDGVFMLEVRGDSMTGEDGVLDGDYIIVEPEADWADGDMVVVFIRDDESAVVKRIWREGESIHLKSSNPAHETLVYPRDEVIVQGKVIGVTRWHVKKGRHPDPPN